QKRASLSRHLSGLMAEAAAPALLARLIAVVEQAASSEPECVTSDLDACSGERQFLHYARVAQTGEWRGTFSQVLREYTAAIARRLANDASAGDDYVGLVAWRRQLFSDLPSRIAESPLLFPKLEQAISPRAMTLGARVIVTP